MRRGYKPMLLPSVFRTDALFSNNLFMVMYHPRAAFMAARIRATAAVKPMKTASPIK